MRGRCVMPSCVYVCACGKNKAERSKVHAPELFVAVLHMADRPDFFFVFLNYLACSAQ